MADSRKRTRLVACSFSSIDTSVSCSVTNLVWKHTDKRMHTRYVISGGGNGWSFVALITASKLSSPRSTSNLPFLLKIFRRAFPSYLVIGVKDAWHTSFVMCTQLGGTHLPEWQKMTHRAFTLGMRLRSEPRLWAPYNLVG